MRISLLACAMSVLLLAVTPTEARDAPQGDTLAEGRIDLHMVPLADGLRQTAKKGDLTQIGESTVGKLATKVSLDLAETTRELVALKFTGERLFYVFYKIAGPIQGPVPYIVQRIKKTERTWESKDDKEPEVRVTWQVEVFKTFAGTQKKADQHYGSFGLRTAWRREIIKEYEIGFARIPDVLEGDQWPYKPTRLFEYVQRYQTNIGLYDDLEWRGPHTKWSLAVRFDKEGNYSLRAPELGIDMPTATPAETLARPKALTTKPAGPLLPGLGIGSLRIRTSDRAAVESELGRPYLDAIAGTKGNRNLNFATGLTLNMSPEGKLNTLITHPGFAGQTRRGIRHGMTWDEVGAVLGADAPGGTAGRRMRLPGLVLSFDAHGRVSRMVVFYDEALQAGEAK